MSLSATFGACKRSYVMHSGTLLASREGDGKQRLLHESDVSSGNVKKQDLTPKARGVAVNTEDPKGGDNPFTRSVHRSW